LRGLFNTENTRKLDELTNALAILHRWGYHDLADRILVEIKKLQEAEKQAETQ
jgi:hypothetical protein